MVANRFIFNNTRTYSMAILPIDGKRYGTPEMLKIFDEQKKIDYQLQIEGAVAISQASLKIIPKICPFVIYRLSCMRFSFTFKFLKT